MILADELAGLIRALLSPVVLVAGAATMSWGLQIAQSSAITRIRLLTEERLRLAATARATCIDRQLRALTHRARYLRNAVTSLFAAVFALLLCSVTLAGTALWEWPTWLGTAWFTMGLLGIGAAIVNTLLDVRLAFHVVTLDCELGGPTNV